MSGTLVINNSDLYILSKFAKLLLNFNPNKLGDEKNIKYLER